MKSLDFPEEPTQQAQWLESEMCSTNFVELVTELATVANLQKSGATATSDFQMTSAEENAVLQRGLRSLPETRLKQLLSVPEKLLEIQQAVLERGGSYWSSVANKSQQSDSIERRLQTTLGNVMKSGTPNRTSNSTAQVALPISTKKTNQSGWIQHATWAAIGSLVTAATILLVVRPAALFPTNTIAQNSNQSVTTTDAGWGFEKFASTIDETTENDRVKYLNNLASAADAWKNKRPTSPQTLAQRLIEFRAGCSAIMLAQHPLPESDSAWLKDRCSNWAVAIDKHLADLESGSDVADVTAQVDSTVVKISAALKGRASTPLDT